MTITDSSIDSVARALALNHVLLSNPKNQHDACKEILAGDGSLRLPERVVLVIGAGASAACAGLPTGAEAAAELRRRLVRIDQELLDEELNRLEVQFRLDSAEFETQLLALSKFDGNSLVNELHDLFYRRHYPSLTYELLAHLLKHRFVDAIVNFNFDELLDQAISDEIGNGNYYSIISDGDCPDDLTEFVDRDGDRFKLPLYIKPHGTASHRSLMRFTRGDYYLLPAQVSALLERLFTGMTVTVLAIGHEMQSVEFNSILSRAHSQERPLKLFFVKRNEPKALTEELIPMYERGGLIQVKEEGLDGVFDNLWSSVRQQFTIPFGARQIERHRFISLLFKRDLDYGRAESERGSQQAKVRYLKDRTYIEIALAVAKAKGFVNLNELFSGRSGKYYRLYKSKSGQNARDTLFGFCESLGLQTSGYSQEALRLRDVGREDSDRPPEQLVVDWGKFQVRLEQDLFPKLVGCMSNDRKPRLNELRSVFFGVMESMHRGDEVEIVSPAHEDAHPVFVEPEALGTKTALTFHTTMLLRSKSVDRLMVVAETGGWLLETHVREAISCSAIEKIIVIVADPFLEDSLREVYKDTIRIDCLRWWLHNQHMTIALSNRVPVECIHFGRRLRSSAIAPNRLGNHDDCQVVFETFVAYLLKAESLAKDKGELMISRSLLKAREKGLLDELY